MRQVPLGRTGLTVSEVAFGGIPIQRLTDQEAVTVVTRCLDLGITFLDTAHGYGTSEERIGKAIAGRRDGLVLATKSPARQAEPFREQMELSFRRLGVAYIDIFQFHNIATQEALTRCWRPAGRTRSPRGQSPGAHRAHRRDLAQPRFGDPDGRHGPV